MVMEASPSPQSVGREFVRQYYTLLNKAPAHLHRFYNNLSSFVHGGLEAPTRETLPVVGQKQIHNRIQQLNFRDCHAKISQVDAQATLGNGVVVQVTGELSNDGAPMRRFTQTFVLAAQSPKKYYVHNDIFRYQDIVFSDEEGSGSGRSEGEGDEEVGGGAGAGYFPGFPAPPPPPAAPMLPSAPLPDPPAHPAHPAHLNGHPQHQDATAPAPAPAPAPTAVPPAPPAAVCTEPEPEAEPEPGAERAPSPEPEREPTPTPTLTTPPPPAPHHPVVVAPPEPKTYANLLKSGGGAPRPAPPAPQPAPPAAPPAPLAPQDQRARPTRAQPPSNNSGESRERGERGERERESREREREGRGGGGGARYSDAQQLFLGNLPHSATEEELRALFARFGPVAELRVHTKQAAPGAPRHPNYGFITYETSAAAHDCLGAAPLYFPADGADGVKLNVEEKKQRGREPPRRRPPSGHRAPAPAFPRPAFRR